MKKAVIFIVGIILLIIGFLYDKQILMFIANNRVVFFNDFMKWISYLGSSIIIFIIMTSLFMWEEKKREWIPTLWVSYGLALFVAFFIIKGFFLRPRPYEVLNIVNLVSAKGSSFPSGHVTAAFAALPILDKKYPMFKWFWLIIAVLIAFSRIYVGVHYFSDVVAGALIGGAFGTLFVYLEDKKKIFKRWLFKKSK